jgi:hypothetical protein
MTKMHRKRSRILRLPMLALGAAMALVAVSAAPAHAMSGSLDIQASEGANVLDFITSNPCAAGGGQGGTASEREEVGVANDGTVSFDSGISGSPTWTAIEAEFEVVTEPGKTWTESGGSDSNQTANGTVDAGSCDSIEEKGPFFRLKLDGVGTVGGLPAVLDCNSASSNNGFSGYYTRVGDLDDPNINTFTYRFPNATCSIVGRTGTDTGQITIVINENGTTVTGTVTFSG